jgi:uncharacterized protein (DUF2252 family)
MTATVVLADVGSMTTNLIQSIAPTLMAILALLGTGLHALLQRTHSPRIAALETDVAAVKAGVQSVQDQTQTIASAASIVSSMVPNLNKFATDHEDRISQIESGSIALKQELDALTALINGDGSGQTGDDSKADKTADKSKTPVQ